jgi:hypothetical protein
MSANKPKKEGCEVCILTLIFLSIFLGKEADVVDTEMQGKVWLLYLHLVRLEGNVGLQLTMSPRVSSDM